MTNQEFHLCLNRIPGHESEKVTAEDYARIEYVYTWHPSIPNVGGKDAIAHIYAYGGMSVIADMNPRARKAEQADAEVRAIRHNIAQEEKRIAEIIAEVKATYV